MGGLLSGVLHCAYSLQHFKYNIHMDSVKFQYQAKIDRSASSFHATLIKDTARQGTLLATLLSFKREEHYHLQTRT